MNGCPCGDFCGSALLLPCIPTAVASKIHHSNIKQETIIFAMVPKLNKKKKLY
jgi:hypothetical protein